MRTKHIVVFMAVLMLPLISHAEDRTGSPTFFGIYLNGFYGFDSVSNIELANNAYDTDDLWGDYCTLAGGIEFYKSGPVRLGVEGGFKYEHFHFKGIGTSGGLYANMLPVHLNCSFMRFLTVGVRSDVILNSHVEETSSFSYAGINENCLNRFTVVPYMAVSIPLFTDLSITTRINYSIIPLFNYDELAYYNMRGGDWKPVLSLEFGITCRIFTSGRRDDAPGAIFRRK